MGGGNSARAWDFSSDLTTSKSNYGGAWLWGATISGQDWSNKTMTWVMDVTGCPQKEVLLFSILNNQHGNNLNQGIHVTFNNATKTFKLYTQSATAIAEIGQREEISDYSKVSFLLTKEDYRGLKINDVAFGGDMSTAQTNIKNFMNSGTMYIGRRCSQWGSEESGAKFIYCGLKAKSTSTAVQIADDMSEADMLTFAETHLGQETPYTINRTFKADGWYTISLPFDMARSSIVSTFGSDVQIRKFASVSDNVINFENYTGHLQLGKPYLIKVGHTVSNPGTTQRINTVVPIPSTVSGSDIQFVATWGTKTLADKGEYFLGTDDKFHKPTANDKTMNGLRAYLSVPSGDLASYVANIDGVMTSLSEIDGGQLTGNTDTRIFNIQGQLVGNTLEGLQPGLYIQGGRKVVVK